jgi:G3E family GTPase
MVDAVTGAANLERFAEAARQAAVADALVISKTDLAPFSPELAARVGALNLQAERIIGAEIARPAGVLFPSPASRERGTEAPPRPGESRSQPNPHPATGEGARREAEAGWGHAHSHGIAAFAIVLDKPPSRFEFARALGGLAQDRGYDLLRVKGLVAFADRPDRPAVIQASQHAMFGPEWLDDWPDDDHRSRLVFIVHDIAAEEILDRFAFARPALLGSAAAARHAGGRPALHFIE